MPEIYHSMDRYLVLCHMYFSDEIAALSHTDSQTVIREKYGIELEYFDLIDVITQKPMPKSYTIVDEKLHTLFLLEWSKAK